MPKSSLDRIVGRRPWCSVTYIAAYACIDTSLDLPQLSPLPIMGEEDYSEVDEYEDKHEQI